MSRITIVKRVKLRNTVAKQIAKQITKQIAKQISWDQEKFVKLYIRNLDHFNKVSYMLPEIWRLNLC